MWLFQDSCVECVMGRKLNIHDNVTTTFIGHELRNDGLQLSDDTIMRGLTWLGLFEHVSSGGSLCYEYNIVNVVLFRKKPPRIKCGRMEQNYLF
jgi:hypothetical protein